MQVVHCVFSCSSYHCHRHQRRSWIPRSVTHLGPDKHSQGTAMTTTMILVVYVEANMLVVSNKVASRRARLLLGWVSVAGKPSRYITNSAFHPACLGLRWGMLTCVGWQVHKHCVISNNKWRLVDLRCSCKELYTSYNFYAPQLVPTGTAEARTSYGISVCPSVRLSVRLSVCHDPVVYQAQVR